MMQIVKRFLHLIVLVCLVLGSDCQETMPKQVSHILKNAKTSTITTPILTTAIKRAEPITNTTTALISNVSKRKKYRKFKLGNPTKPILNPDDSYMYSIRAEPSGNSTATEIKGLLVRKNIVASARVPALTSAKICTKDDCHKTKKVKDTYRFSFWQVDNRRSPITFRGSRYNSTECVLNSKNKTVTLEGNNKNLRCLPACEHGDVLVCNNLAAGVVIGERENSKLSLASVRNIMREGGFNRKRKSASRPKKKKSKSGKNEHRKKMYDLNRLDTIIVA